MNVLSDSKGAKVKEASKKMTAFNLIPTENTVV